MNWLKLLRGLYACMHIIHLDKPVTVGSVLQLYPSFELIKIREPLEGAPNAYFMTRSVGCMPAGMWTPRGPVAWFGEFS